MPHVAHMRMHLGQISKLERGPKGMCYSYFISKWSKYGVHRIPCLHGENLLHTLVQFSIIYRMQLFRSVVIGPLIHRLDYSSLRVAFSNCISITMDPIALLEILATSVVHTFHKWFLGALEIFRLVNWMRECNNMEWYRM